MRSIGSALRAGSRFALAAAGVALLVATANPSKRPQYGGTLRVELQASSATLDPREWKTGATEAAAGKRLAALVFDRLVSLDNYGRFQPQLATEWTHDAAGRRWQFAIRSGVKFSDGTPLTPADIVTSLQTLLPSGTAIFAASNGVVIQPASGAPDLLEQLASGRYFVFRVQSDRTLLGSGPFFVAEAVQNSERTANGLGTAPTRMRFKANEGHWAGRPFVDEVEVTLGVLPLRALFDLQLRKTDLIELSPELVRRASQAKLRTWASAPVTMYGLRFDEAQAAASDERWREALALALDRATMANVLLQRQAEPARALLPQWLSGYASLFTMETNLERAKELRSSLNGSATEPLRLQVDVPGETGKLLGERVAVNARQAGISVQVTGKSPAHGAVAATARPDQKAGLHLFVWRYESLSSGAELRTIAEMLGEKDAAESGAASADAEQVYAREKRLLEQRRVLPLVTFPDYAGLGPDVRDWMPARWGEWHLAEVWLEREETARAAGENAAPRPASNQGEYQ